MKKRIITGVSFTACLTLCAAVWPQSEPVEETPTGATPPAVAAAHPQVSEGFLKSERSQCKRRKRLMQQNWTQIRHHLMTLQTI